MNYRGLKYLFSITRQDRITFFGSGKVAFPSLRYLHSHYPNLQVVTQYSPKDRRLSNQVQKYCQQREIRWSSPITSKQSKQKRSQEWTSYLQSFNGADFGVVCSYGYMIPSRIIERFAKGLIVIHPSLLPKYRGGSPIFHAIANGENVSGVSFIQISKNAFDQGRILHQVETKISRKDEYSKIQEQLTQLAAKNLPYVLQNIDNLRPGTTQQDMRKGIPSELLLAPIIKDKKVNLSQPAEKVYHLLRAFTSVTFQFLAKDSQIIIKVSDEYADGEGEVGAFKAIGKKLFVRCEDKFLRVVGWYEPTKKELNAGLFISEFIRGGKYPQQKLKIK